MKVTCILIACFIFWLITVNAFFFSSYIVAHLCTFPFWQWFKKDLLPADKWSEIHEKKFWSLNFKMKVPGIPNTFYLLNTYHKFPIKPVYDVPMYFPIIPVVKNGVLISSKIGDVLLKNLEA